MPDLRKNVVSIGAHEITFSLAIDGYVNTEHAYNKSNHLSLSWRCEGEFWVWSLKNKDWHPVCNYKAIRAFAYYASLFLIFTPPAEWSASRERERDARDRMKTQNSTIKCRSTSQACVRLFV